MLQRCFVGTQLIELMLRKVADREPRAAAQLARLRHQVTGHRLDQRRFTGAVDTQDSDAVAGAHGKAHTAEHGAFPITEHNIVSIEQPLGQLQRLRKLEAPFAPRAYRLDRGQTIEHLQSALRLTRLRCFRAKPVDETLQVRGGALVLA